MAEQFTLACGWAAYFAVHSLLADDRAKRWAAAHFAPARTRYRLIYNVFALGLAIPLIGWIAARPGPLVWAWEGAWAWVANGLAVAALLGFVLSLRDYDMGAFAGFRASAPDDEPQPFALGFFHRYVRHPWYCFGLILVWTRDWSLSWMTSAIMITAYLVIGSRLEERRLLRRFGAPYARYRERVPGLIPLPWRHLSAAEANELSGGARR